MSADSSGMLVAHTDGACSGNPGPGGWGVVLETPSGIVEVSGGSLLTTNNQMEMQAVLQALAYAHEHFPGVPLQIHADSQYTLKGITEWRRGWERKGWRTSAGKPVKNIDLWRELFVHVDTCGPGLEIKWVRGHAGDPGNELADSLAQEGLENMLDAVRRGSARPFRWVRHSGRRSAPFSFLTR